MEPTPEKPINWEVFNETMRNLVIALNEAGIQFMNAVESACVEAGKSVQQLATVLAERDQQRTDGEA